MLNKMSGGCKNKGHKTKYHCLHCSDEMKNNDKAVCCDQCNKWFHIQCIGVPDCVYDFIGKNDNGARFSWHCNNCRKTGKNLHKMQLHNIKEAVAEEIRMVIPDIAKSTLEEANKCTETITKHMMK